MSRGRAATALPNGYFFCRFSGGFKLTSFSYRSQRSTLKIGERTLPTLTINF
ncbi:hypothetical protein GCWU000325_00292 [Alloprevotella tannerae ATCC 51259]|uniref:Uncharacterized protein n=1 Tax=Alloprevotella tannerae ATCC 51259 TaxID=626522 RepID=C9LDM0_9BACT|nr:hypothetical protein GCWU000325_00292 [Alloprevotella tannerae ATCC 51259]